MASSASPPHHNHARETESNIQHMCGRTYWTSFLQLAFGDLKWIVIGFEEIFCHFSQIITIMHKRQSTVYVRKDVLDSILPVGLARFHAII